MGIFQNVRSAFGLGPRFDVLASPFTDASLTQIVYSDIFGVGHLPITRAEAMSVPALSKARTLIAATVGRLPLRVADSQGLLADGSQPEWTYRTDGMISPFLRMLWTIDDLLFFGHSLWIVERDTAGDIIRVERVPYDQWKVTTGGGISILDVDVTDPLTVIYFSGPVEGILDKDAASIRAAKSIAAAVEARVKNPIPVTELHATGTGDEPTTEEAAALVAGYNKRRSDPDGVTVYTPSSVQLITHGDKADSGFMVEGRNAVRLDVANMTGVPAALLDGSVSQSSLTYTTQEGRKSEFVEFGLAIWIGAIEGRLSQDDVVAKGLRVVLDQTEPLNPQPAGIGPDLQD